MAASGRRDVHNVTQERIVSLKKDLVAAVKVPPAARRRAAAAITRDPAPGCFRAHSPRTRAACPAWYGTPHAQPTRASFARVGARREMT